MMGFLNYLQNEQTKEIQEVIAGHRELQLWNAEASCLHAKDAVDGGAGMVF
jgi:hypothetical protein